MNHQFKESHWTAAISSWNWIQPLVHHGQYFLLCLAVVLQGLKQWKDSPNTCYLRAFTWKCQWLNLTSFECRAGVLPLGYSLFRRKEFPCACYVRSFNWRWKRTNLGPFPCEAHVTSLSHSLLLRPCYKTMERCCQIRPIDLAVWGNSLKPFSESVSHFALTSPSCDSESRLPIHLDIQRKHKLTSVFQTKKSIEANTDATASG